MGDAADDDDVDTNLAAQSKKEATRLEAPQRASKPRLEGAPDFGPRYRVIGVLGKGGMGQVYRAYDTELRNEVAVKIVREDTGSSAYQRFLREIALARKVTSPNVLRVYDLAEHEGLRFLTMELVDGEDLAAMLRREPRMPRDRAVALFRQVCAGLEAAHKQGVVHRDLKPHNVLVDRDGAVRVADFGLARSIGDSGMTASGAVLGSPAYMSPEQVKGDPTDERSDIYSLGILLYQLLTGETPFHGETPHSVMEMRLHKKPRPLRELVPDLPAHLEAVALRCLALDPADRYASVEALRLDLVDARPPSASARPPGRWKIAALAGAGVAGLAIIAALVWPRGATNTPAPVATPPAGSAQPAAAAAAGPIKVLILPPQNRTNEPVFDETVDIVFYYGLRSSEKLDPVAGHDLRALAATLGAAQAPLDQVGKVLVTRDGGSAIVVRPEITFHGSAMAFSFVATDASSGAVVLENTQEAAKLTDAVSAIIRAATALRARYGESAAAARAPGISTNIEADHEYAAGVLMSRSGNPDGAIAHLARAVELDAHFTLAHSALATAYNNATRFADAARESKLALELVDETNERDRLLIRGRYYMLTSNEADRAIVEFRQLLDTWPNDTDAIGNLAYAYLNKHDFKGALEAERKTARLTPHDITQRNNLINIELVTGNPREAVAEAERTIAEFPRVFPSIFLYKALAHSLLGDREAALAAYAQHRAADASNGVAADADFALAEGRFHDAAALLEPGIAKDLAEKRTDAAAVKLAMLAETRLRQGDKAAAIAAAARVTDGSWPLFMAAQVQVAAGDIPRVSKVAAKLAKDAGPEPRAYGMLINAELLRARGKPAEAVAACKDALQVADAWWGEILLGRAQLDAGKFADASRTLRAALERRGEGVITQDDLPALRTLPQATYYLARALEGQGDPAAAETYKAFLAMQPNAEKDVLVEDARKRLAGLAH